MATWISLSRKIHLKEIFAALMILLAIVFFRSERSELQSIWPQITHADSKWIITGCIVTIIYILFQASIYRQTFAAIGIRIQWFQTIPLFLKRNLLSVFLPAGGISSLAYTPSQIRNAGLSKMQVHQASGLYGFVNLLSVLIVGIPIIVISVLQTPLIKSTWTAVIATCVFILLLIITGRSIKRKGWLFTWLERRFPAITPALHDLFVTNFSAPPVFWSFGLRCWN
jgi:phosphatidylglycerol lysyltransferase